MTVQLQTPPTAVRIATYLNVSVVALERDSFVKVSCRLLRNWFAHSAQNLRVASVNDADLRRHDA